jgi:hypothetical protein
MNALTETRANGMVSLAPQNFEQALTFANYLADSDMVPKDFKGKPGNCLIAMQWGAEVGLQPLQALQNIAVINGRPSLWGDSLIALVRASPAFEYILEEDDGKMATCRVKRRGEPEQARTFSMDDAKAAGLQGKQGPWTQYPKRMRQMRARAFALRDVFPDVLRGMPVAEEVMDTPKDMGTAQVVDARPELDADALIKEGWSKAEKGMGEFGPWFNGMPKSADGKQREILKPHRDAMLAKAKQVDDARTVEQPKAQAAQTGNPAAPAVTYEDLKAKIENAQTLDALMVSADWIGELADPTQREELTQRYLELAAKFGG